MPTGSFSLTDLAFITIADNATQSRSLSVLLGLWGRITAFKIVLNDLTHTRPDDLDFLLIGPDGRNLAFWSDIGGSGDISSFDHTIDDAAGDLPPDDVTATAFFYRPADYETAETSANWAGVPAGLIINHPTPNGSATMTSAFGGAWLDNSNWSFRIRDDTGGDSGSLGTWGVQITYNIIVKPHNFNGGNVSDMLWQHADGTAGIWLMNGFNTLSFGAAGPNGPWPYNPGASWRVKGDGDFNDDGISDILWQNLDGTPGIWLMNGFQATSMGAVGTNPGPGWQIKDTGDFNFDNKADILWQSADGTAGVWLMDGMNVIAAGPVGINPGTSWQIKGAADFNNDGKADILWQSADGTAGIWLMDGMNVIAAGPAGTNPGTSWQVKGTGDFNDDGHADILWQHADGTAGIWLMNGMTPVVATSVGTNPGPGWQIKGSGDYNADQRSDILWQSSDGQAGIWFMSGTTVLNAGVAGSFNPGSDWQLIG